ncbi:MAG TPA: NUDIX hydrolase [Cyclobacteriaceae bacterium]|nr:NUDIX hydrolase [Cyclobacteriaceae bacterium]
MVITCGAYLFSTQTEKLLVCHPTHSRWNTWSIPKGLMEPGEDILSVCLRELKEETGIDVNNIHVISRHQLPSRKYQKQNKSLESILLVTDTELTSHKFTSNLVEGKDFPEIDKWKWIDLVAAAGILHQSQIENLVVISTIVFNKK